MRQERPYICTCTRWDWTADVAAIGATSDLISVQCGMSSQPIPERMDIFRLRSEMISIITSHQMKRFTDVDTHALHPRGTGRVRAGLSVQTTVSNSSSRPGTRAPSGTSAT